jgi:two-component system response regulator FixJ
MRGGVAENATIFILDDDAAVRDSLGMLIESAGYRVETFASAREFLARPPFPPQACLLLDVHMPEMSGLQLQDELARRGLKLPVVVMTGQADVPVAVRAMKAGALDFIEKPFSDALILESIRNALTSPTKPAADPVIAKPMAELTPREHDVMLQMIAGNPNKVTAYNLSISPRTVEIHRARVMEKMAARSLSELVRMALAIGIDPAK